MRYSIFVSLLFLFSCNQTSNLNPQTLVDQSIQKHGLNLTDQKTLSFDFRDYHYVLKREGKKYQYSREHFKGDSLFKDILDHNATFQRSINGNIVQVSDSLKLIYSESLNSVMYFIQTPLVLNDAAVIKKYIGETRIKGETYHSLKVTFREQGGGDDYEDEYRYWIHGEDYTVDYLAYNYLTSGGGTRFREAVNRRRIKGVIFQDYNNYKPAKRFLNLDSLPLLFEAGKLKQVSVIENKNIQLTP